MTVPDDRDVVVTVEVSPPVRVEQPHALPPDEVERAVIGEGRQRRTEGPLAPRGQRRVVEVRLRHTQPCPETVAAVIDQVREQRPERRLESPEVVVVRMTPRPPGEQHGHRDQTRREQIGQHRELLGLERRDGAIAIHEPQRERHDLSRVPPGQQGLQGRRHVAHERGVAHVPPVDDATDPSVLVDEGVVEGDVAVDHLRPELRPPGRDERLETIEHGVHEGAVRWVVDRIGHRAERRRVLHVPEQHAPRGRVEERSHRAAQASDRDAVVEQRVAVELDGIDRCTARHEPARSDEVRRPRRSGYPCGVRNGV